MVTTDANLVARLGVLGLAIDARLAALLPSLRRPGGVLVAARAAGAPAAEAGLAAGDLIFAMNGTPVTDLASFRSSIDRLAPGAPCVLHVQRGDRLLYVAVELE
jgi:S1-C subfamily serine protease